MPATCVGGADAQHIAGAQRASGVTAELPEGERGATAHVRRHVEAAAHGEVTALSGPFDRCRV
jgi:N-methylhydantoinase A/oxoprolinase/acetone carboxylase beta subunit